MHKDKIVFRIFLCNLPGARAKEKIVGVGVIVNSARVGRARAVEKTKAVSRSSPPREVKSWLCFHKQTPCLYRSLPTV